MARRGDKRDPQRRSAELPWGIEQLARDDGRAWAEVLAPIIADTAQLPPETMDQLHQIDAAVAELIGEFHRHRLPVQVVNIGSWSIGRKDPVTFTSLLVGHRAERLLQTGDLVANALQCLERGALLPAAASARSALEIAAMCVYVERRIDRVWKDAHGQDDLVREAVLGPDTALWNTLIRVRVGSKLIDDEGAQEWPKPVHINDAFEAVAKEADWLAHQIDVTYARLCDAVHPSHGAQGAMWRRGGNGRLSQHVVLLSPRRSQSPTKVDIVAAVTMAGMLVGHFARFLWWVATDVSLAFKFKNIVDNRLLGAPLAGKASAPCVCASGSPFSSCTHPRPGVHA